jgi:hypothetical protein
LKEGVLFRRCQEAGPPGRIAPDSHHVSAESGARGAGFKRRVEFPPLAGSAEVKGGIEQHHHYFDVVDFQLRGGKSCQWRIPQALIINCMVLATSIRRPIQRPIKRWIAARPYLRELRARPELGLATLFDPAYYRKSYHGPLPPLLHFIVAGAFEGHNPHPLFDCAFYLRKYPEVAASGVNPLFHYLLHGAAEGRKPHPLFQPDYVGQGHALPPLLHFLSTENPTNPHPLFDCHAYMRAHPEAQGVNPMVDFVEHGHGPVIEGSQSGQGDV